MFTEAQYGQLKRKHRDLHMVLKCIFREMGLKVDSSGSAQRTVLLSAPIASEGHVYLAG
jgi:hypothetical protein